MNDIKNITSETQDNSVLNLKEFVIIFLQHWKWFILSFIVCIASAAVYLHYKPRVFSAYAKVLIKDDESVGRRSAKNPLMNIENLGSMTNSTGIDNEVEILGSPATVEDAVHRLNLNIDYALKGRINKHVLYLNQPVSASIDMSVDDDVFYPIHIMLGKMEGSYKAKVKYSVFDPATQTIEDRDTSYTFKQLPYIIKTEEGNVTLSVNHRPHLELEEKPELITISSYASAAIRYANNLLIEPTSKVTTIANISYTDVHPLRITDFLNQLIESYNTLANDDKNEVAERTEEFINGRLEKIDAELGATETQLESYKRSNNVFELRQKAQVAITQQSQYEAKLTDASTQIELLTGLHDYMSNPQNRYEAMPFNVGIQDQSTNTLIARYNEVVLARKRLLVTSSEQSPNVVALTSEVDGLAESLRSAIDHALKNAQTIYRIENEHLNKYASQLSLTPSQERVLTQIGRQQEVRSDIYLMLLQKREENSISLAATADKGKLVDKPMLSGVVSPKPYMIFCIAFALAFAIPFAIFILLKIVRYKIESRDDITNVTNVPIVGEIGIVANGDSKDSRLVVHENSNDTMDEMFRMLRTNVLFSLNEVQKVILTTSCIPGEGKTFVSSNLAMSFAIFHKRVLLVGLDIRKPRLATAFGIHGQRHKGITNLLTLDSPTIDQIREQIVPSGIHDDLDLLMSGPIPPNPTELLGRPVLEYIIDQLKDDYDYIILDTAPIGLVTDTIMLSKLADANLVVCRINHTNKSYIPFIDELATTQKMHNLSVVINGVDLSSAYYKYRGHYGRYGGYYAEEYKDHRK